MPIVRTFDGIELETEGEPGPATRRLTPEVMNALRRRRTGVARGVSRPLRRTEDTTEDEELDELDDELDFELDDDLDDDLEDSDDSDDSDDVGQRRRRRRYKDDGSVLSVLFDCCGARCLGALCMLVMAGGIASFAITYGVIKAKSYEELVTPIRIAKQRWINKKPTSADDGFILFDRNADGIIDQRDLKVVAKLTTGETPPDDALQAYIRRGDLDGDLALNETEYLLLLAAERASGKGFLEWQSQPQGEDKEVNKEGKFK